jgi:ABC-type nickel/cobalt efflux system permease component RcnA
MAELPGLVALVAVTGLVHGAEPGHGWPVAAAYAVDGDRPRLRGLVAGGVIGVGHLVSSVTVVVAFFWAKSALGLDRVPHLNVVAGLLLIGLGVREYLGGGHSHDHGDGHGDGSHRDHGHDDHGGGHSQDHGDGGHERPTEVSGPRAPLAEPAVGAVRGGSPGRGWESAGHHDHRLGTGDGDGHDHDHGLGDAAAAGLGSLAWTAFVLGFAHEEEFELIGICAGTSYCLELTLLYGLSVLGALVASTLVLVAGYERYEDRVEGYAEYFPALSAAVLVAIGVGFLLGVF